MVLLTHLGRENLSLQDRACGIASGAFSWLLIDGCGQRHPMAGSPGLWKEASWAESVSNIRPMVSALVPASCFLSWFLPMARL